MKNGHFLSILLITTAILPYVAVSCRHEEAAEFSHEIACSSKIHLTRSAASSLSQLNTFVYFADSTGLLDSFQYMETCGNEEVSVGSTAGLRRIVMTANFPTDDLPYDCVLSYGGLCSIICDLAQDNPEAPFMSGETICRTGPGSVQKLCLSPLMSRIVISSLEVDFSSHPYRDKKLDDIKAYLTNVNGRCPLAGTADGIQSEIYNYGAFDREGCKRLSHPEILYCEDITKQRTMYCYPNVTTGTDAEVLGRAVTRLVIEGRIDGTTYYYPVSIGKNGVEKGRSYIFDIKITGTGMTDPDKEASSGMMDSTVRINDWYEYDEDLETY